MRWRWLTKILREKLTLAHKCEKHIFENTCPLNSKHYRCRYCSKDRQGDITHSRNARRSTGDPETRGLGKLLIVTALFNTGNSQRFRNLMVKFEV